MDSPGAGSIRPRFTRDDDLTPEDDQAIRLLLADAFPRERDRFLRTSWWGTRPDARQLLELDGRPIAHASLERRVIEVGSDEVLVAGIGDVAVHPDHQRRGVGRVLFEAILRTLLTDLPVPFGVLACGPSVTGFLAAVGLTRLEVTHRYRDADTGNWEVSDGPAFVLPAGASIAEWPPGPLDLRGTSW
jgi:GNAT superfamily N-acetyltransferase